MTQEDGPERDWLQAGNYFVADYPPFSCWTEQDAAAFHDAALGSRPVEEESVGLYVHVPFCEKRCDFCYYLSYAGRSGESEAYVSAVIREAGLYGASAALGGRRAGFAYFGGGTPSLLAEGEIERLISGVRERLSWEPGAEVSFECAPRSVTPQKMRVLAEQGVTRVSLGVQQLNDVVLARNGRVHRTADVLRAYDSIRETGFGTVNVDLIVGLLGESDASFFDGLESVMRLEPDSVTIYQLEIPRNTKLHRQLLDPDVRAALPSWPVKRERLRGAFERLEQAGFAVRSAYAAVRDPDRHRFVYQDAQYEGATLLGLGASSFSHVAGINQQNVTSLYRYVEALEAGTPPLWRGYVMTDEERMVRELVLQLKLGRVELARFLGRFGVDLTERYSEELGRLAAAGRLTVDQREIALTRAGLLEADDLVQRFYLPAHRGIDYC